MKNGSFAILIVILRKHSYIRYYTRWHIWLKSFKAHHTQYPRMISYFVFVHLVEKDNKNHNLGCGKAVKSNKTIKELAKQFIDM